MEVPSFLKIDGESAIFNVEDSELIFFVPEDFFNEDSKSSIAMIDGEYVSSIGIFSYAIVDKNGRRSRSKLFNFPTMFLCKPYDIEKVKNYQIDSDKDPDDYRLLKFRKGDEVISQTRVPELLDNTELFFKAFVLSAKIPQGLSYDTGWMEFDEAMELNGNDFLLNEQMFGMLWRALCRDPEDVTKEFRFSKYIDKNPFAYKPMSIKMAPNFLSPYTAMVSEYFDESMRSAVLMKDKKDLPYTPLEKIVMQ